MHQFHFATMRAAAVTSLTRAALTTGMGRLDTNYPQRYPSDLMDAEWALDRDRSILRHFNY